MKTSFIKTSLFIFSLLLVLSSKANTPKETEMLQSEINEKIRTQLGTPRLREHGIKESQVLVNFKVLNDGKISIESIEGENQYLIEFVEEKLAKMKIKEDYAIGKNIKLPIIFTLIS